MFDLPEAVIWFPRGMFYLFEAVILVFKGNVLFAKGCDLVSKRHV